MEEGEEIFKSLVDPVPFRSHSPPPSPQPSHARKIVEKGQLLVASL